MAAWLLLLGFAVGLVGSLPPAGPGALLQIRRGLQRRFAAGLAVAAGGGLADAIYCLAAVLGLGFLLDRFPALVEVVRWLGLAVLFGLGAHFLSRPPRSLERKEPGSPAAGELTREFLLGLTLTGTNPTLVVTWTTAVAVIASLGVPFEGGGRFTFPLGIALGNVAWSAILLTLLTRYGHRLGHRVVRGLMRATGVALLIMACMHGYSMLTGSGPL